MNGAPPKLLAPLRGVTIRCFREVFAEAVSSAGFVEAVTPFISANAGVDPLRDRELKGDRCGTEPVRVTPQFIGKDPEALRECLLKVKAAGYDTVDLNAGCPFPMVRNKGRGSGILKTPDVLRRMLEVGCETMGEGRFSLKARLGVDRPDELLALMPMINVFPLRFLTVHARTARQMYEGRCEVEMLREVEEAAEVPVVINGDIPFPPTVRSAEKTVNQSIGQSTDSLMIGRSFIRHLGVRDDAGELVRRYAEASCSELCGDRPVLGRMKELLSYWKDLPGWRRKWDVIKICRSVDELLTAV